MIIKNIEESVKTLKSGGVILYPTDTIWGIGCDATNTKSIEKIYKIKNRPKEKPLILLVNNTKMLSEYVEFPMFLSSTVCVSHTVVELCVTMLIDNVVD